MPFALQPYCIHYDSAIFKAKKISLCNGVLTWFRVCLEFLYKEGSSTKQAALAILRAAQEAAAKKAEEELKKQTTSKFADLNEGLRRATEAVTKQIEKKREVEAILSGYKGIDFKDVTDKIGSLANRVSGWCNEAKGEIEKGLKWVGEKAGEVGDAVKRVTQNTIQSFIDHPVENLVIIDSGAAVLYLTAASFGTLPALAALLGNTAVAAYGGATVYGIYEYKSGDKEKGEEDLKKVALSAITMAGAFGAQGNVNVTNTPGGNVQPNGSLALEGGRIIGYSIALEGVTSISSEVTDALGITQSAIANGGGSSGTNDESNFQEGLKQLNSKGVSYPEIKDPRTGKSIPMPEGELKTVPKDQRVEWNNATRSEFIKEWYDRGYETPEGGWEKYDIHHILPREYGGTNDFENLVPVERTIHQTQLNSWWQGY